MKLVKDTDPILRQPTVDFDFESGIDPEELSKEMAPLMFEHGGIGLAAPQVGLNYNMFLLGDPESAVACFNPRLVSFSEETIYDVEGCLTFPGLFLKIGRPKEIVAEFTDSNGKEQTMTFTEIMARCFCHELDHLKGILYTDKVAKLTLQMARQKQKKLLQKLHRKAKRGGQD
jgi:peptide deformylase|tara:strand:+ start:615 stop:1133 length:519 start_codon:yes stop_codon:yes gene_type:complete